MASMALMPVWSGSCTGLRPTMPGAWTSMRRCVSDAIEPLPSIGWPSAFTTRPTSASPTGTVAPTGSDGQLTPASTKLAVLNGTTIPGLASREKDTLTNAGFNAIATGNNTDQQRAESAVLYGTRAGARAQARTVAQKLNIATVERLDADTRDLSEGVDVVVILGQDKAP